MSWNMTDYLNEIKKQFWTRYQIKPSFMTQGEPIYRDGDIPDGEYPMDLFDMKDLVKVRDGKITLGNWKERAELDAMSPKEKIVHHAKKCANRLLSEGKIKTIWDVRTYAIKLAPERFNEKRTSDDTLFIRVFMEQCFRKDHGILKESIRTLPKEVYQLFRAELGGLWR